jgi:hypothetical protein
MWKAVDSVSNLLSWLFPFNDDGLRVELSRVQLEERIERRKKLDMDHSGAEALACFARVRRRMTDGDNVWIPPMHGRESALHAWLRRHPKASRVIRHFPERGDL